MIDRTIALKNVNFIPAHNIGLSRICVMFSMSLLSVSVVSFIYYAVLTLTLTAQNFNSGSNRLSYNIMYH